MWGPVRAQGESGQSTVKVRQFLEGPCSCVLLSRHARCEVLQFCAAMAVGFGLSVEDMLCGELFSNLYITVIIRTCPYCSSPDQITSYQTSLFILLGK